MAEELAHGLANPREHNSGGVGAPPLSQLTDTRTGQASSCAHQRLLLPAGVATVALAAGDAPAEGASMTL